MHNLIAVQNAKYAKTLDIRTENKEWYETAMASVYAAKCTVSENLVSMLF